MPRRGDSARAAAHHHRRESVPDGERKDTVCDLRCYREGLDEPLRHSRKRTGRAKEGQTRRRGMLRRQGEFDHGTLHDAAEAALIHGFVNCYKPRRCLEWGIGGSTVTFSTAGSVSEWVGIEHSLEWIAKVQKRAPPAVTLHFAPASTAAHHYCSPKMIAGYVNHPACSATIRFPL